MAVKISEASVNVVPLSVPSTRGPTAVSVRTSLRIDGVQNSGIDQGVVEQDVAADSVAVWSEIDGEDTVSPMIAVKRCRGQPRRTAENAGGHIVEFDKACVRAVDERWQLVGEPAVSVCGATKGWPPGFIDGRESTDCSTSCTGAWASAQFPGRAAMLL
ncbi:MAG: hypothetical protein R3A10_04665 [Caldilineaceae bacterium]